MFFEDVRDHEDEEAPLVFFRGQQCPLDEVPDAFLRGLLKRLRPGSSLAPWVRGELIARNVSFDEDDDEW
jgi:hypothetical protein